MRICKFLFGIVITIVVFTGFEIRANAQTRTMPGETVALYGTETRQLLYPIEKIKAVYNYDTNGRRIDYKEGIDYVKEGTGIRRVSGSAIYDFNNYVVTYKPDGKFTWVDTPRNPPFVNFLQGLCGLYGDHAGHHHSRAGASADHQAHSLGRR